jgi:hypothetical protein
MFANADRYPGYWFSCELLLSFFFSLLLLIAGIDDDDGRHRIFGEKRRERKKATKYACKHPHIHHCVDHKMSLLVTATFLPRSQCFFWIRNLRKKKKKEKERKRMEEKKIVHPIADARGRGEFCRLACTSLYRAGGHDWSKTENEQI